MKAKPKSLALAKFQQAGQLTIAKNKQTKAESKKDKGIDVIQVGSIASAAFLVLWIIASTMVSAVFTVRYMGIVEEDQAWYLLEGSARTAAAEAKAVMAAAMQAKSDLIAAIDHGLIKTSYDYAAIESTLVPTMALKPYVHSFEMIFTDRQAGLKIGHREEENGRQLLLQSNGADCYLLGTQGCADLGVPQNKFPAWQAEAMYLNLSFTGGSEAEIISQAQMIAIGKQAGPAEQWLFPPVLDAVQGSGENVTWYPIVRLIFRQPLPAAWAPQQEILCGRISLQVAALSKDHLRDSQLGDSGKTFLVDASGTILSAVQIQDTLAVDSVGAMQMRRLTDLPDASWSGSIAGAFRGDRIDAMQVKEGWLAVVVYPLPMPLNMFAIVVVSQAENSSFQDSSIFQSMIVLMAFTSVPYVVVFVTLSVVFFSANTKVGQEMKARKSVFARFAEGVTDFAAAQGVKMKHRNTVRPMSKGSDGPLFTKEMEGMGRKISQTSVLSAGEIYDAEDKPLAVQPRKTHIMNDAYFEADRSCKGYCVRCVRCFCACCRGRAGY